MMEFALTDSNYSTVAPLAVTAKLQCGSNMMNR